MSGPKVYAQEVLELAHPELINKVKSIPLSEMTQFHSTLGMQIRNRFELWKRSWTPNIVGGMDISPDHPDNFSMKILEEFWKLVNTGR